MAESATKASHPVAPVAVRTRAPTASRSELEALVEIARAMSQERDIDRLLSLILAKSREITGADAGSIYVVDSTDSADARLRFKLSQNDSCAFEAGEYTLPISNNSIAGAVVLSKRPINIPDAYQIASSESISFDPTFDQRVGYTTRSIIAVPLISAQNEVLGVVQLINKKRDRSVKLLAPEVVDQQVVSFDEHSEQVLTTLAAQAGIALENALLYAEINAGFEGFVRASVQAIEQRDPTTSGHSLRVSVLSCDLAECVSRLTTGIYGDIQFTEQQMRELEYASLLHDFGKIGVREQVLLKAKKLYAHELEVVKARLSALFYEQRAEFLAAKLKWRESGTDPAELLALERSYQERCQSLRDAWDFIQRANEPTVLQRGDFSRIVELGKLEYVDEHGDRIPLLAERQIKALQVTKGSLAADEIEEIREHVVHTFQFLSRIPWGKSFKEIPEIAAAHHERLNGSGYPYGLSAGEIPLRSKIMAVADVYDALTAQDRPYKKALSRERALDILKADAASGHLDQELVQIFTEAELYRRIEKPLHY